MSSIGISQHAIQLGLTTVHSELTDSFTEWKLGQMYRIMIYIRRIECREGNFFGNVKLDACTSNWVIIFLPWYLLEVKEKSLKSSVTPLTATFKSCGVGISFFPYLGAPEQH